MFIKRTKILLTLLLLTCSSSYLYSGFLDSFNDAINVFDDAHDSYKKARGSAKDAHESYKEVRGTTTVEVQESHEKVRDTTTVEVQEPYEEVRDTTTVEVQESYEEVRSYDDANGSFKDKTGVSSAEAPEETEFYIAIKNVQQGPFNMGAIKEKIIKRKIGKNTLVWKEGMKKWTKAGEVPNLEPLFKALPPPLPPPLP
ncbi:MAG TPA: DUF4339 domain-containing protein [Victivallales bacterium]|nr:DUF4339 domain-containing protein [Victivallales bacterium]